MTVVGIFYDKKFLKIENLFPDIKLVRGNHQTTKLVREDLIAYAKASGLDPLES